MEAGSSSSSMLFFGMMGREDDQGNPMMINPQMQDSNSVPSSSLIPATEPLGAASLKKRRNQPRMSIPDAEIIALSPTSIMATNRFTCEICHKGFQREQNLQLHRRRHNLPGKLKQKTKESVRRKVYLCPVPSCVHHHPFRALGDLTGIKKHFSRKHGEKKFKCHKCSKMYAIQEDCKAHSKICGMKEYKCDWSTLLSRRDNFGSQEASNQPPPPFSGMPASLYGSTDACNNSMGLSQMAGSHPIHHPTEIRVPMYPSAAANQLSYLRADNNLVFGPSMGLNRYKPAPTKIPTADRQHQHEFHGNSHSGVFDNLMNYNTSFMEYGEGSSMLSGRGVGGSLHSPAAVHNSSPHLSATALLQKEGLIGSISSYNSTPPHMLAEYASSSSRLEDGGLGQHFGVADSNGHNSYMDELFNSFTSNCGVGLSSVFNDDESNAFILEESHQPPLVQNLRAGGLTLTRDFLGVGPGDTVRSISSSSNNSGPQSTYGGVSFL